IQRGLKSTVFGSATTVFLQPGCRAGFGRLQVGPGGFTRSVRRRPRDAGPFRVEELAAALLVKSAVETQGRGFGCMQPEPPLKALQVAHKHRIREQGFTNTPVAANPEVG